MIDDFILFGPPGAGKGTQAQRLEQFGLRQISTGDLMRSERSSGSALGKEFDSYMSQGLLVPDSLVISLFEARLSQPDSESGAVFDGFPRTVAQAEALEPVMARLNRRLKAVVVLEVPDELIVERISGRRSDPITGQVYHTRYNPPPAGTDVVQRADDTEEVVRKRVGEYRRQTEPVLGFYEDRGIVQRIDGSGELEVVAARVRAAIGK